MLLRAELGIEQLVQCFRAPHLERFAGHHRPRENRKHHEDDNDRLAFRGRAAHDVPQIGFSQKIYCRAHAADQTRSGLDRLLKGLTECRGAGQNVSAVFRAKLLPRRSNFFSTRDAMKSKQETKAILSAWSTRRSAEKFP